MSLLYAMHQQYKLLLYICTRSEVRRLCMSPQQGQFFKGCLTALHSGVGVGVGVV